MSHTPLVARRLDVHGWTDSSLSRVLLPEKDGKERLGKLRMSGSGAVIDVGNYLNLQARKHSRKPLHIDHESIIGADQSSHRYPDPAHLRFTHIPQASQQGCQGLGIVVLPHGNLSLFERICLLPEIQEAFWWVPAGSSENDR